MSEYQSIPDRLSPRMKKLFKGVLIVVVLVSIVQLGLLALYGVNAVNELYYAVSGIVIGFLVVLSSIDMFLKWQSEK